MDVEEGRRRRVVIEGVNPEIDGGRFPIKRVVGEKVEVGADIYTDGFELLSAVLRYRREEDSQWAEVPMEFLTNDRWRASFVVKEVGRYHYSITGWVDKFKTWWRNTVDKMQARQDISDDIQVGAGLIAEAAKRASRADARIMKQWSETLLSLKVAATAKTHLAFSGPVAELMNRHPDQRFATTYPDLAVVVDREKARFGSWYEMFPHSAAPEPGRHGTFDDCIRRLPYISAMGFDVLYLPPIHPIGHTNRKGKNNTFPAGPDDRGSLWAIGSEEGGHKSIHPQLGTLKDFRRLVTEAGKHGIEIALDISFSCSPDHPYAREHPEWFYWLPDGRLKYAENPPNRYEDITFFNFDTEHWRELWEELKSIIVFWIEQGVRLFRVDNPHTKPFPFWEWLIPELKKEHPDLIFLAEAFTRPRLMYRLSRIGFTQSYTYFVWRNTKRELTEYFSELTQTEVRDYFRPSLWTNTPDNLTPYLQTGGRPAFMARLVLAATLGATYGIYGPAFELGENRVRRGSEEYLNSENYEIKYWDINRPDSLKDFISRVNRIRRENAALRENLNLRFHNVDNAQLICYSKHTEDHANVILVVVNLDPHHTQAGWTGLFLEPLGLAPDRSYQVHDLLSDARYGWRGARNYVELDPQFAPAHIFRIGE